MKFASYDDAYVALGVPPGSDFFEVKRAWRYLVKYQHPDIFENARLREEATEKLKAYNAAYDLLRRYWEQHRSMPAPKVARSSAAQRKQSSSDSDRSREQSRGLDEELKQARERAQRHAQHQREETRRQQRNSASHAAYEKSREEGPQAESAFWEKLDREHPYAKPEERVSFGPPPMRMSVLHSIFGLLEYLDRDTSTMWMSIGIRMATLPLVFLAVVSVADFLFKLIGVPRAVAMQSPLGGAFVLLLTAGAFFLFYSAWHYQYKTYRILLHPFIEMSYRTTPDDVFRRLRLALRDYVWQGCNWNWSHMSLDNEGTWTVVGVMNISPGQRSAKQTLRITVKIWERAHNVCALTFWFEEEGHWFKKSAAIVLSETRERLCATLGVPNPHYRVPVDNEWQAAPNAKF